MRYIQPPSMAKIEKSFYISVGKDVEQWKLSHIVKWKAN